jgi:hypothetical protein
VHTPTPLWSTWINEQCRALGISQKVVLLESRVIRIPAVMGIIKPVILVPAGLLAGLSSSQVEAILLHELAHVKRKDYLVNILQSVVDALFFFNPAFTWLSSLIRQERESCCDEMVVRHSASAENYIEALLFFQQLPGTTTYAMALDSGKGALLQRVKRMLTKENNALTKKEVAGLLMGVVVTCFCLLAFRNREKEPVLATAAAKPLPALQVPATKPSTPASASLVVKVAKDTVPPAKKITDRKIRFKQITTNQVDDGKGRTEQTIATDDEGNRYRVHKEGGVTTQLEVNGKVISPEAYPTYYPVLDALEQRREDRKNKQLRLQEKQQRVLEEKQSALAKQLSKLDEQRLQHKLEMQSRKQVMESRQQQLQEKRLYAQAIRKDSLKQLNRSHKSLNAYRANEINQLNKANKRAFNAYTGMNPVLATILQDLKEQGMIENETKFSFSLREGELMVNGKAQSQSMYEVFRKKYLKSSGDSFSYFRDGGTTRTEVHIQ